MATRSELEYKIRNLQTLQRACLDNAASHEREASRLSNQSGMQSKAADERRGAENQRREAGRIGNEIKGLESQLRSTR